MPLNDADHHQRLQRDAGQRHDDQHHDHVGCGKNRLSLRIRLKRQRRLA
jgi:hypothetical protein